MINYKFIYYLSFFLISLQSYYSYSIGVAIFPYMGVIIIFIISFRKYLNLEQNLFIIYIFIFYVSLNTFFNSFQHEIKFVSFLGLLLSVSILIFKEKFNYFVSFIPYYLYIHTFFFSLQFIAYYFFNINIDYLYWFNGEIQRTGTGTFEIFGIQLFRTTGLFVEPATFFIYFAPIVAIKWLIIDKKLNMENVILIIISLLTFSSFGFIFWIIIFGFYSFYNLINFKIKFNFFEIILIVLLCVVMYFVAQYFFMFFEEKLFGALNDPNSNSNRIGFIQYLLGRDVIDIFFGTGFSNDDLIYSVNDSGVISNIFYRFGVIGLCFFIILGILLNNYKKQMIYFVLLLTKLSITHPFFWLIYGILLYKKLENRDD